MNIYNESDQLVENPDLELGYLKQEQRFVAHHDAIPEQPQVKEIDYENPIWEDEEGNKIVKSKVVQEYQPAVDEWDEYEDIYRYVLYTEEELAEIAEQKAAEEAAREQAEVEAAEREEFLSEGPERLDTVESSILDHDEFLINMFNTQLDTDEAIVSLYELIGGIE